MMKRCKTLVKIALVGVAMTASGCTLGTNTLVDDLPPGLTTAFGNAGGDHDNGNRGNGGNRAGGGNQVTDSGTNGGGQPAGGGIGPTGPGNSGFGRGGHANAGSGDGSEYGDTGALGGDVDPGNSGNSNGRSATQD